MSDDLEAAQTAAWQKYVDAEKRYGKLSQEAEKAFDEWVEVAARWAKDTKGKKRSKQDD